MYYDVIRQIIREGGDTDTNAAIVGGMLGALLGVKKIPAYMVNKVLQFDCLNTKDDRLRPEFLSAKLHAVKKIKELINIRPTENLEIINNI